jgi:hypothetical protein
MQSQRVIVKWVVPATVLVLILVLAALIAYKALAPLPPPIPHQGQVLNAKTGKGIPGAQLETSWQIYDYPMLDGAGSYEISSITVTDNNGHFSLVIPRQRRGIWKTESNGYFIRANGYNQFTCGDNFAITYVNDFIIFKLTPE